MNSEILYQWDGEGMLPSGNAMVKRCNEIFVVGAKYRLAECHERSSATHRHYFSVLHDIWQSLPDSMTEKFPTEEHLRKYALIKTGYRLETQHFCKTPAEAERLALAIKPYDTYQLVGTDENIVTVYNAISQDMRSMDKQTFQKSKEAVLDFCSDLVGIDPVETRRLAGVPVSPSAEGSSAPADVDDEASPPPQEPPLSSAPADAPSQGDTPKSAGAISPEAWLLNVSRMLWPVAIPGGDFEVLKNQKRAALIEFPKPEDCPERISGKADSVYRQCGQIIDRSLEPGDGLALIAGIVGVDQDEIMRKAGT